MFQNIIKTLTSKVAKNAGGIPIIETDAYDRAYKWAWEEAGMQDLIRNCYKSPDFSDNARRFFSSDEFCAVLAELESLGAVPGNQATALDFGCGNGVASYALARAGFDVTGVDSSVGLLAGLGAAKKLIGLDGVQPKFDIHTGEVLDFPAASFDVIYIREVLHHIHGLVPFLAQIRKILKPGGVVCCLRDVVIWNENQREHFFANHPLNPITQDEGCYYLDEYLLAFIESGLELKRVLSPTGSIINSYPIPLPEPTPYDYMTARSREYGYDLFSFFAVNGAK